MILLQKLFICGNSSRLCMTKYKFTLKVSLLQIVGITTITYPPVSYQMIIESSPLQTQ